MKSRPTIEYHTWKPERGEKAIDLHWGKCKRAEVFQFNISRWFLFSTHVRIVVGWYAAGIGVEIFISSWVPYKYLIQPKRSRNGKLDIQVSESPKEG